MMREERERGERAMNWPKRMGHVADGCSGWMLHYYRNPVSHGLLLALCHLTLATVTLG